MNLFLKMRLANKAKGEFRAEANVIWIYDVIASDEEEAMWMGGISPREFIAALGQTTGPVTLRINSPGGSVFGAQAMITAMKAHPQPITAQIDGLAASAASVIACSCAETVMAPGSMMMIHNAWGMTIGDCDDHLATSGLLEKIDAQIAQTYADKCGGKPEDFADMMDEETWFTADEAVSKGLADSVIAANNQKPSAKWDLSGFAKAPQEQEIEPEAPAIDMTAARARQLAARLALSPI